MSTTDKPEAMTEPATKTDDGEAMKGLPLDPMQLLASLTGDPQMDPSKLIASLTGVNSDKVDDAGTEEKDEGDEVEYVGNDYLNDPQFLCDLFANTFTNGDTENVTTALLKLANHMDTQNKIMVKMLVALQQKSA